MNAKWTKGPWSACAGDDCAQLQDDKGKRIDFPHIHIGPNDHGVTYKAPDGRVFFRRSTPIVINAVSNGLHRGSGKMAVLDANARLIAASPEMAELLERIAEDIVNQPEHRAEARALLARITKP